MKTGILALALITCCAAPGGAQQPAASALAASAVGRLLTAKIIYVAPMPDRLDQWLIEDLRAWGKYKISDNPQGVDLEMRAEKAQTRTHFVMRDGTVQRKQPKTPPVLSVTVVDWVTGAKLWQAKILNAGAKKNQTPPAGPDTEIHARHMTPDQVAQRCVSDLRLYVTRLQEHSATK